MKTIALKLTVEEVSALLELVDTQLLRVKFIDTKFPGHKSNPEKLKVATSAVRSLRETFNLAKGFRNREVAVVHAA
jgi:hypothetical protein